MCSIDFFMFFFVYFIFIRGCYCVNLLLLEGGYLNKRINMFFVEFEKFVGILVIDFRGSGCYI